jgi:hypothetical protein
MQVSEALGVARNQAQNCAHWLAASLRKAYQEGAIVRAVAVVR